MTKPKKFVPMPQWGLDSQAQLDEAVKWIFEELLGEKPKSTCEAHPTDP
jgi:hypothetical protein